MAGDSEQRPEAGERPQQTGPARRPKPCLTRLAEIHRNEGERTAQGGADDSGNA
jgi:hypothetical protein